jgi:hypothetical protein
MRNVVRDIIEKIHNAGKSKIILPGVHNDDDVNDKSVRIFSLEIRKIGPINQISYID